MILYEHEYALLSPEHFDYDTQNKSFIRMYSVLKRMGIQNNKFFLVLLDTELKGIDPHNLKDDSMELKLRIGRECKTNPWYAFRMMIRVPAAGTDGVRFELSRANLGMIWLYANHIDNLLIMPRQLGKTIGSIAITALIIYILGEHLDFAMLTKDNTLRKENVSRLKDIRDAFPEWFVHKQRGDADNMESVGYLAYDNTYKTFVAQMSISGAERLGRGMTVPSQHWDEVAYFKNISVTYPIAISTTNAAVESAKAHGQPYGNILTTTAGMLNTDEGQFTHGLICSSLTFTEKLYDLPNVEELNKIVEMNSPQRMVYSEFSYEQLGKTKEWFEYVTARTAGGQEVIDRDYLNRWTFGTSKSPVDRKLLDRLYNGKVEPSYIQYVEEFMVKWYIPKEIVKNPSELAKIPIVIGMDASEMVGRDFTSFVFSDARDMSVIAVCSCNISNIIKVAMFICKWLVQENVVFIPERNSVGCAIIDYCLMRLDQLGINPFFRIYNTVIQEFKIGSNKITRAELSKPGFFNEHRQAFGFRTSSSSRPFLYKTVFTRVMETSCHRVKDISLINQIAGLTVKNGRIDHGSGGNDDSVIAYILTGYLLFFGENIEMYDFCKGIVDTLLRDIIVLEDGTTRNTIDQVNIDQTKQEIVRLERSNKYERNNTLKVEMMHKINTMKSKLPVEDENVLSDAQSLTQLKGIRVPVPGTTDRAKGEYIGRFLSGF